MIILSDKTIHTHRTIWKINGMWLTYHTISYDLKKEYERQWWLPFFIGYPIVVIGLMVCLLALMRLV